MSSSAHVRNKTLILTALMVSCNTLAQLLLRQGMLRIGSVRLHGHDLAAAFLKTVTSGTIWIGIAGLLAAFAVYMTLLSWADYSYVQPATSLGYALVALLGVTVLGEHVSLVRWTGVALICSGVALVGRTEPRTTKRRL
jgi:drug/metabolite transporter (DMT)-like permease